MSKKKTHNSVQAAMQKIVDRVGTDTAQRVLDEIKKGIDPPPYRTGGKKCSRLRREELNQMEWEEEGLI